MARIRGIQAALIAASIRRRGVVAALAALLSLLAVNISRHAATDVFPEFAPKLVTVQTEAPGLTPLQVESLVTQPLEAAANGMLGVKQVLSKSMAGISVLKIHFRAGTALEADRWRVAQRLAAVRLPPGVNPPRLTPLTSSTGTVLIAGLTSDTRSLMDLNTIAQWQVRQQLLAVPGVSEVLVFGGRSRALQVQVEPAALLRFHVGLDAVLAATRRATGLLGAGYIDTPEQRLLLQSQGLAADAPALAGAVLRATPQGVVTLGDVAHVAFAPLPAVGAASVRGQEGVILVVNAQYGANTLQVTRAVQARLAQLRPGLAQQGVTLHPTLFRPADFIDVAVRNVRDSLLLGGLLVVLVIVLFLLDWRAALISSLAIPLSLLAAVTVLVQTGVTLNVMTLGGLAIAIGVVVDDAVIDVENILRRLRDNRALSAPHAPLRVVLDACLEVRGAVVYATAAVLLVVVPVLLLPGLAGRLFAPLAQAYALAVLASLAVALTVTPALAALLLARHAGRAHAPPLIRLARRGYDALLRVLLPHWLPAILATALFTGGAAWLATGMGGSFLPPLQEGQYIVHMHLAPGASLDASLALGARIGAALEKLPEVRVVAQHVGRATLSPDAAGTQSSEIDVDLKPGANSARALADIRHVVAGFAGATFRIDSFFTERLDETASGGNTAPLAVQVFGNHLADIDGVAQRVAGVIAALPGASGVQVQAPPGVPQLDIDLKPGALRAWGLQPLPVLTAIRTAFAGSTAGTVYRGAVPVPVRVVLPAAARDSPRQLGDLLIRSPALGFVPLAQLASITPSSGSSLIEHIGGQRVQTVLALTTSSNLTGFVQRAEAAVRAQVQLPPGVTLEFSGEAAQRAQTLHALALSLLGLGTSLALLLAMALRSARQVLLVLLSLPAAWAGGVLAAWLVGGVLSLGAVIGLLALMGISLRNAILIFAHTQHLMRTEGRSWSAETLRAAVGDRLAPIVMTTLVTALGVLPLALGLHAPGREIEGPMAVALLGGLLTSLLFNLLALPALALRFGAMPASGAGTPLPTTG